MPRAIIGQRGSLRALAGIYLNFKKIIFGTMRTTRKQFPVNWLTSGRLAFTIQRAKARRRQQIKKWRHKWRDDVELINWPSSTKNLP